METAIDHKLVCRLIQNGVEASLIPGFIRSLANAILFDPNMSICKANQRLKYLGWNDIEIDNHTFELAVMSLADKGLSRLEYKAAPFYVDGFKTGSSKKRILKIA